MRQRAAESRSPDLRQSSHPDEPERFGQYAVAAFPLVYPIVALLSAPCGR
jgi:hypothetical protein